MNQFEIDQNGILWVRLEWTEAYASTGLPCEPGQEQDVWDSIPDGQKCPSRNKTFSFPFLSFPLSEKSSFDLSGSVIS